MSRAAATHFAPCPRGLEALLAAELARFGARDTAVVQGGVSFTADLQVEYRANLGSRIASRILRRIAEFEYRNEADLYAAIHGLPWPRVFQVERTIRVDITARGSPLKSLEFATLRAKDAVCDRFRAERGSRPSVSKASPDVRIQIYLEEAQGTVYLDTSGEPLFKRGARGAAHEAPLRENLAAGIILLTGWKFDEPLLDPMCGGGTLIAEAAAMARGRPPGLRRAFAFERLNDHDPALWRRERAVASEPASQAVKPRLFASDRDPKAIAQLRRNLAEAGVERWVTIATADVLQREAPAESGVLVANPPYGERIGSADNLARFYPRLGDALKAKFAGWRCHFFTADLRLPKLIRLTPARRVPLHNGALDCRLYEFSIVAGSHRRQKPARPPGEHGS